MILPKGEATHVIQIDEEDHTGQSCGYHGTSDRAVLEDVHLMT